MLSGPPVRYGYQDEVWSIPLIRDNLKRRYNIEVSEDTILRSLKELNYSYKRPSKAVSSKEPDAEEKRMLVEKMIEEIKEMMSKYPGEIFALDESHFSTAPYLVRGWFKKRWPIQDSCFKSKRKMQFLWLIKFKDKAFLLEKVQAC